MLKHLRIQNLILIETAEIPFDAGLNVLSGETGSGKSAILHALALVSGERADATILRHGTEKGYVEATFEIETIPGLLALLQESGIDHESENELIIRREISANGKSRSFVNQQAVQLTLLRKINEYLFELVGQHANQQLLDIEQHRSTLDLFGSLSEKVSAFSKSWEKENALRRQLEELISNEAQRLREIETCQRELEELEAVNLKDQEEESLFAEYSVLSHAEQVTQQVQDISHTLSGERNAILTALNRHKSTFDQLVAIDPSLTELAKLYETAILELHEVSHTLHQYQSRIECNPQRAQEVNDRLTLIDRLKRRYGTDLKAYLSQTQEKLKQLENADSQIEQLQKQLNDLHAENDTQCQQLTVNRKKAATQLAKAVEAELKDLQMAEARFYCEITSQQRTRSGDDRIEFFLSPNVGERKIPVRECASGGELSRLMLAVKTVLAGKAQIPTLIFDEIDANIGGETAVSVGEKLRAIGEKHQVLCITHFSQVAQHAMHHLQIAKQEQKGRTFTTIQVLATATAKKNELARMSGSRP